MVRGALAAAVTPLRAAGTALDEAAVAPYVDFLAEGGLDGILALGTTGEGILLSVAERKRLAALFSEAARGRLMVVVHCGAQTTADTVALARHAAELGAAGVAVIGPPYFALDDRALLSHFTAAARACDPLPFFVYEFERASGYAVPVEVVERLRAAVPNVAGLKVSDAPFARVAPYMLEGLDVFVGAESLIDEGLRAGGAGAVSALAAAFPELVSAAVHQGGAARTAACGDLRGIVERFPRHAAFKAILGWCGVPVSPDVRAPLRQLDEAELADLQRAVEPWLASS